VKEQTKILRIKHGSHLYGTNTPTSDEDFKEIHIPAGREILLQRAKDAYEFGPEKEIGAKNQAGDIDVQSFSVQKFFSMLMGGDIIGCELLFAPMHMIEHATPLYFDIVKEKDIFLSRQVEGYVGYCRRQANKYGIRGSRVKALRDTLETVKRLIEEHGHLCKVGDFHEEWLKLAESEHIDIIEQITKGTGKILKLYEACNRKIPYTVTLKEMLGPYQKAFDEYGHRSLAAESNEGVDWKAVSHAVRVGEQAIELLKTGFIEFPRENAEDLLAIKKGQIDYKIVSARLEELLVEVEAESLVSILPEKPNKEAVEELLVKIYADQIN
jgi:hypothetical protein